MFPREHFRQPFERSLLECRSSVEGRQAECSHSSVGVRDPSAKMCIEAKQVYVPYRQEHPSRIPKLPIEMRQRPPVGLRHVPIGTTDPSPPKSLSGDVPVGTLAPLTMLSAH